MRLSATVFALFLTVLTCGQPLAATLGLINSHVPILAGAAGEIEVRELEFLTWYATPESRIQAVLWTYKANSPHKEHDGANINPASEVGLRISATVYPLTSCVVTLDISDMTTLAERFNYPELGKREVIAAVIAATRENLRASQVSACRLEVTGASSHQELREVVFPSRLDTQ